MVWRLSASKALKTEAEFSYLTEGISWKADYDVLLQGESKISEFVGWITVKNDTGTAFPKAKMKLIAGDVVRLSSGAATGSERVVVTGSYIPTAEERVAGSVTSRAFDEYREFALPEPVELKGIGTTQLHLLQATDITLVRSYVYENGMPWSASAPAQLDPDFETQSPSSNVLVVTEFKNEKANHLGLPLPKGLLHFYRTAADGHPQFVGDSALESTAADEMIRAMTGSAFDLVGERKQTDFREDEAKRSLEESFEIKLRNHREEPVEIRVREHLTRWRQWNLTAQSIAAKKNRCANDRVSGPGKG